MPIVRLGWPVAIAMLLIMVSFALSLAYSHLRLRPVGEHVLDVIDNAAPSIDRLSAAHTELGRFGLGVTEYVLRPAHSRSTTRQDVVAARRAFAAQFDAYKQLPLFPGEAEAVAALERDLGLADESMNRALDGADRRSPAAEVELHESFYPLLFKLRVGLAELMAINTRNARISAESTLRATREATFLATVLGVSSLVLAIAAMLLVLRVLRGRARLMGREACRAPAARALLGSARAQHPEESPEIRAQGSNLGMRITWWRASCRPGPWRPAPRPA